MKILYVGEITRFSRSHQRLDALRRLGHEVAEVSYALDVTGNPEAGRPRLIDRVRHRLGRPVDRAGANQALVKMCRERSFDLLWIDKGLCIRAASLREARAAQPGLRLVFSSDDDMFARHNQSHYFRQALPHYDLVVTAKSYNARPEELPALGARRCFYHPQSFDPDFHRPVPVTDEDRKAVGADVGFIGTFEVARAESVLGLAAEGIEVRVFGNGWDRYRDRHPKLRIEARPIYGEDYIRALSATKINLGFLRKANRDLHTSRSLDIPACGAFYLAERTDEHANLFREGVEAEYFEDQAELVEKVRSALDEPERRLAIAAAGRARCLADDYSHDAAMKAMLEQLEVSR